MSTELNELPQNHFPLHISDELCSNMRVYLYNEDIDCTTYSQKYSTVRSIWGSTSYCYYNVRSTQLHKISLITKFPSLELRGTKPLYTMQWCAWNLKFTWIETTAYPLTTLHTHIHTYSMGIVVRPVDLIFMSFSCGR